MRMRFTPNPIRVEGDVAYMQVAGGAEVVIDRDDVELVSGLGRWVLSKSNNGVKYVVSDTETDRRMRLHRELMGNPKGEVLFKDGNALNCRRGNLVVPSRRVKTKLGPDEPYPKSSTGVRGVSVYLSASRPYYRVSVAKNGKQYSGGYFPFTPQGKIEAADAAIRLRRRVEQEAAQR